MFRAIRRSNLALPTDVCQDILTRGSYGTLALLGDDDYPYAVPVNYVLDGRNIYVHCAPEGHKMDAIARHDKASFSVVEAHKVNPEDLSTDYRSVLVFGRIQVVEDNAEKLAALHLLCKKFVPDMGKDVEDYIARKAPTTAVIRLSIEHMSGKEGYRLARARNQESQA